MDLTSEVKSKLLEFLAKELIIAKMTREERKDNLYIEQQDMDSRAFHIAQEIIQLVQEILEIQKKERDDDSKIS